MKSQLKKMIYSAPVVGLLTRRAWRGWNNLRLPFSNSGEYWERRYRNAGNSGAGSYGRLSQFKAEILNEFVMRHEVRSIVEFGSGDGNQLSLANFAEVAYLGFDISQTVVSACQKRFAGDQSKSFMHYDSQLIKSHLNEFHRDLSLSLDVIFHLVEDATYDDYMQNLFDCASRFVVIYSSNKQEETTFEHVRHRIFTDWVNANRPEWVVCRTIHNRYPLEEGREDETSFSDFYIFARRNSLDAFAVTATSVASN